MIVNTTKAYNLGIKWDRVLMDIQQMIEDLTTKEVAELKIYIEAMIKRG